MVHYHDPPAASATAVLNVLSSSQQLRSENSYIAAAVISICTYLLRCPTAPLCSNPLGFYFFRQTAQPDTCSPVSVRSCVFPAQAGTA